jgi:hypothetical protein
MDTVLRGSKRQDATLSTLNAAIEVMNIAKASSTIPAKAVFGSVSVIIVTIKVGVLLVHPDELQANVYSIR